MSKLDDILGVDYIGGERVTHGYDRAEQKQQIIDLVLELIGETNSFQSENTGRVWIDPDHLIKKVNEL